MWSGKTPDFVLFTAVMHQRVAASTFRYAHSYPCTSTPPVSLSIHAVFCYLLGGNGRQFGR